jgi:hypothetical protein
MLVVPASAHAAFAKSESGKLTYTGINGEANHVAFTYLGNGTVRIEETGKFSVLPIVIAGSGACEGFGGTETCTGVNSLEIKLGDVGDYVDSTGVALPTTVTTGNHDDRVYTGAANDSINTHDGSDIIDGGLGTDSFTGGPGSGDVVSYASHSASQPVVATLDGAQNDGCATCGENDNIRPDVESLAGGAGNDSLTGGSAANVVAGAAGDDTLTGAGGNDTVEGGAGTDTVDGGEGDDTLAIRDATVDRLACGAGSDGGSADPDDTIDSDCETVSRGAGEPGPDPIAPGVDGPDDREAEPIPFNLAAPVIPPQTAEVTAAGVALVQVVCPADAGRCRGTVDLLLLGQSQAAKRGKVMAARRRPVKPKARRIGRAKFNAKAGTKPIVPIRLDRRGRRRVIRRRGTRCRVVVTTRSATGKTVTTTRDITLARRGVRVKRPKKPKKR